MSSAPKLSPHLQHIIEDLCRDGCHTVRELIEQFENGHAPEQCIDLSASEQRIVLKELKSIMSVYDRCEPPHSEPPQ